MEKENKDIPKKKNSIKKTFCTGLILMLVSGLLILSIELYKEKNEQITLKDIQSLQKEEINKILDEISKHIMLPDDETPTIATITDVDSLRKQMPFFNNAKNGFKVIIYSQKAILFDPVNNIIVDVAPVVQGSDMKQQGQNQILDEKKQDGEDSQKESKRDKDEQESKESDVNKNEEKNITEEKSKKDVENGVENDNAKSTNITNSAEE